MRKTLKKSYWSAGLAFAVLVGVYGAVGSMGGCERDASRSDVPRERERPAPSVSEDLEPVVLYTQTEKDPALLEDFENPMRWAVESADDHATIALTEADVTQGERALKVVYEAGEHGKFQIRRDGEFDLSKIRRVRLDVTNTGGEVDVALGLKSRRNGVFWGSNKVTLGKGLTHDVTFALPEEPSGYYSYNRVDLTDIERLALTFFEGEDKAGAVILDNMRLEPPPPLTDTGPAILGVTANRAMTPLYGLYELEIDIDTREFEFFRRDRIDVFATLYSPSGRTRTVRAFVHGLDDNTLPDWRLRFAPDEPGRWWYDITVRDRRGEDKSPMLAFEARSNGHAGFVRVSPQDSRFLETSKGEFFYPVGMNVAWATNMGYYLDKLTAQGANTVRIWICPWHLQLENPRKPGTYNLAVAKRIDDLLDQASARNMRVILVLQYHGMLTDSWDDNPLNTANGGPCASPEEVFTNKAARELFQRKLDYAAARWGHSTALLAWELWNEVDYGAWRSFNDVVDWHKAMAEHLHTVDPYDHIVTTSTGTLERMNRLADVDGIDMVSCHLYAKDMPAETLRADEKRAEGPRKPFMLAEFGAHPGGNAIGSVASRMQFTSGLWLSATMPWAGSGLSWWWDTRVDRDDLYPALRGLARLTTDLDRRGQSFREVRTDIPSGADLKATVRGLLSPSDGLFYIYDPERLTDASLADRPLTAGERGFTLEGLLAGPFAVEIIDARTGELVRKGRRNCTTGRLFIKLPDSRTELAIRLKHTGGSRPAFRAGGGK